jgi:hypothetical protein
MGADVRERLVRTDGQRSQERAGLVGRRGNTYHCQPSRRRRGRSLGTLGKHADIVKVPGASTPHRKLDIYTGRGGR